MFKLGKRSLHRLQGVKLPLVECVQRAIQLSPVDFTVVQGLRTLAEQTAYVASGASQTMRSKHLTGHAVDLAAWVNGTVNYDEHWYYDIAEAMQEASIWLGVPIVWGGVWDKSLNGYSHPENEIKQYQKRQKARGRKAFADLGHFELKGE